MPQPPRSPIFTLNAARPELVAEVVSRVTREAARTEHGLELALNDVCYAEIARREADRTQEAALREWTEIYRGLGRRSAEEKRALLDRLVTAYAWDIVGNFDPRVYRLATTLVPRGLKWLFKSQLAESPGGLRDRVEIQGEIGQLRALAEQGTVILVPTHASNLDSVLIGYALEELGLPPFTYGAGKNLFTNPFLSYFMRHLGAYRVDRRLKQKLYIDTLKAYSEVLLERGYHSLFFPGGGRSRSGAVEQKLKLGLMGTGLAAYQRNVRAGKADPDVYVVPVTINTPLTLEAETLIDDDLKATGKNRYIIEDDESARFGRTLSYIRGLLAFEGRLILHVAPALDVFGNRVDETGRSLDPTGRPVDPRTYLQDASGAWVTDPGRDAEYVRELGGAVAASFKAHNVAMSTHVVAFALFGLARAAHPEHDLYHLVRLPADTAIGVGALSRAVERVRETLAELEAEGKILCSSTVREAPVAQILQIAKGFFRLYHARPLVTTQGDQWYLNDMKLLLYYHNRLTGYGLERLLAPEFARAVPHE